MTKRQKKQKTGSEIETVVPARIPKEPEPTDSLVIAGYYRIYQMEIDNRTLTAVLPTRRLKVDPAMDLFDFLDVVENHVQSSKPHIRAVLITIYRLKQGQRDISSRPGDVLTIDNIDMNVDMDSSVLDSRTSQNDPLILVLPNSIQPSDMELPRLVPCQVPFHEHISRESATLSRSSGITVFTQKFSDRIDYTCRWEEGFFEIPPEIAWSVFNIDDRIVLHRRRAVDELYDELRHGKRFLVKGPPGSGKSTSMFAFAISRASEYTEAAILWIVADARKYFIIGKAWIEEYKFESINSWSQLLQQIRELSRFREIYVDQCRLNQDNANEHTFLLRFLVGRWFNKDFSSRLFCITSDGGNKYKESGFSRADVVRLKPWTLEEYRVVLQNKHALEKFSRSLELSHISAAKLEYNINLKFYFAGISARFFFDYTIPVITRVVKESFTEVPSFDDLFKGNMGTASPQAVNVLFHNVDGSTRFSSRFIVDELLARNCVSSHTFVDMAEKLGFNPNRGAIGVLFESYTLTLINGSGWDPLLDLSAAYESGCPYSIPTTKSDAITIRTVDYTGSNDKVDLEKWYKPFKPSNPGYDAFYAFGKLRSDGSSLEELVIVFLQVTCGKSHSFDPQHFATAAVSISNKVGGFKEPPKKRGARSKKKTPTNPDYTKLFIEIVFAVPSGRKDSFTVDKKNVLTSLGNLDKRWSLQISVIAEVPDSAKFL